MSQIDYRSAAPAEIEAAIGRRLEQVRLAQNVSQAALAAEAGVSRRTITRLENGQGVSLDTLIRVLKALGLAERLDTLLPDATVRPIERVSRHGRERQRARGTRPSATGSWTWADEDDEP